MTKTEVRIVYPTPKYFRGFHKTLNAVAKETLYLEMVKAPPFAQVAEFQQDITKKKGPVYYALDGDRVVGWCDIFPNDNPRMRHKGSLGMGLLKGYRGRGIGSMLMKATLRHAKTFGLEKVELSVYHTNKAGIALYEKFGFKVEGVSRKYRKMGGRYFDAVLMAKFL